MTDILKREERAVFELRQLYRSYGYVPYKMSRFEEYELYVNNKDFLVSDQVITFSDKSGQLLALKPDVTLSIIKNAADSPNSVQKVYYNENVYRTDKQTGSFREILQTGIECVGDLKEYDIAEVLLLSVKSLEALNKSFIMDISHMGLVSSFINATGLTELGRASVLDSLRRKSIHEFWEICANEKIEPEMTRKLSALFSLDGSADNILQAFDKLTLNEAEETAVKELRSICGILAENGYKDNIRLDFSVGTDMKYYSGIVFKGYLEGISQSILSGGRYDKLLRKMGRKSSAIGFAVYADLLCQLDSARNSFDVDTVIIYDQFEEPSAVMKYADGFRTEGSVLVCSGIPENRTWRRLIRFRQGEGEIIG